MIYSKLEELKGQCYIGSTCQGLYNRWLYHLKTLRMRPGNCTLYKMLKQYGHKNFGIKIVEKYPCKTKLDLLKREQYYIDHYKCKLTGWNMQNAYTTPQERQQNKNKSNLSKYHENKLSGKYRCNVCDKNFGYNGTLVKHNNKHHATAEE